MSTLLVPLCQLDDVSLSLHPRRHPEDDFGLHQGHATLRDTNEGQWVDVEEDGKEQDEEDDEDEDWEEEEEEIDDYTVLHKGLG